jgi:CRP/FNR family transcriptional regulator
MDQLPCLAAIARGAQLDAGEALFHEDDPAAEVFTVTSGMLKLSKLLPDGRRQITGFLTPGDYLGLAFAARYVYSAEAVTPVRVCRFSRPAFLGLLEQISRRSRRRCSGALRPSLQRPSNRCCCWAARLHASWQASARLSRRKADTAWED